MGLDQPTADASTWKCSVCGSTRMMTAFQEFDHYGTLIRCCSRVCFDRWLEGGTSVRAGQTWKSPRYEVLYRIISVDHQLGMVTVRNIENGKARLVRYRMFTETTKPYRRYVQVE